MGRTPRCLVSILCISLSGTPAWSEERKEAKQALIGEPDSQGLALFDEQIKPVLVKHCYECHSKNGADIEGGLELDSPSGMVRGGDSGPALIPHEVERSQLIRVLRHEEDVSGMPPGDKLPDEVILAFEEWIRLGAPDSRDDTGPTAKEERLEVARRHWAFLPPRPVAPPPVQQASWPREEIDRFVLSSMEVKGLRPVADANRRTLVRRAFFDLIGLPPSPQEVAEFAANDSPDALADLIDQLLDSPRFGERWGRHWLDVVRYAESSGMEFNFTYPHAWPYRDYVIDAFNEDKPYDLFLREQIAGDLMPTAPNECREAIEAQQIAPSILAFVPKRHNSGGTEYQLDVADAQIDTVLRSTLAMTVACARCHDHKFDPIPTREYYALAGIFRSTEPLHGTIKQKYSNHPTDLLPIGPDALARHTAAENHQKTIQKAEELLAAKRQELSKAEDAEKQAANGKVLVDTQLAVQVGAQPNGASDEFASQTEADQEELQRAAPELKETGGHVAALHDELARLEARLADLKKNCPPRPAYAMSARDRAKPTDTKLAIRGNFRELGEIVPRGFLGAVPVANTPKIDPTHSGRLELAQWIASSQNPLTARVMVNRIWHHLFGRGLVSTVDNFGMIGKPPSHPQLLDVLALRFVSEGWSIKRMVRTIMLTRAYQLSSNPDAQNMNIDPDNRLLWRATPRRLDAEAIRDAILAVSGQLDLTRPIGSSVTQLGDQLVRGIPTEELQPPSNHRSVYLPIVRDYVPELFDLFDFPSPSLVSGRRSVTNVPSQALYLRNSTFVAEQAKHAAKRLLDSKEAIDDAGRVELATRWALARGPTGAERAGALRLIQQVQQFEPLEADRDVDAWAAWFHALFTTAEFRYLVDIK